MEFAPHHPRLGGGGGEEAPLRYPRGGGGLEFLPGIFFLFYKGDGKLLFSHIRIGCRSMSTMHCCHLFIYLFVCLFTYLLIYLFIICLFIRLFHKNIYFQKYSRPRSSILMVTPL